MPTDRLVDGSPRPAGMRRRTTHNASCAEQADAEHHLDAGRLSRGR